MSDLFDKPGLAKCEALAPVIQLHPEGLTVRSEEREDEDVYWVDVRRGGNAAVRTVMYTHAEALQLWRGLNALFGDE